MNVGLQLRFIHFSPSLFSLFFLLFTLFLCASVPMLLCAFVTLSLCVFVSLWFSPFAPFSYSPFHVFPSAACPEPFDLAQDKLRRRVPLSLCHFATFS